MIFYADGDSDVMDSLVDRGQELVPQRLVVVVGLLQSQVSSHTPLSHFPRQGNMRGAQEVLLLLGSCWLRTFLGQSLAHYRFIIVLCYIYVVFILINYDYVGAGELI